MLTRLIVNADDFGYTPGINQAIVELHGAGVLTSATLMANGLALEDALRRLVSSTWDEGSLSRDQSRPAASPSPTLDVGCHVVLVDGSPVAPPSEIPSLLASTSPDAARSTSEASFRATLGSFVADLVRGRIREADMEREAITQIRRLQAHGIRLTHIDTHKHTHIFPRVLRPLLRAALQCGIQAVRNPFEPSWSRHATVTAPILRRMEVGLLDKLRPSFLRLVDEAGLRTTAGALGILATGVLDEGCLDRLLHAAERASQARGSGNDPVWELVCHPGYNDAALGLQRTRLRSQREMERTALLGAQAAFARFSLQSFGRLSGSRTM